VDALVLVGFFAPCGVAKAGVATLPMIGAITRGLQFLFVTRSGTTGKTLECLRCANLHIACISMLQHGAAAEVG
jgi:hypothetical protein